MRDPKRIDEILSKIKEVWDRNPDLRLGQLLLNCARDPALYYIEDDDLVKALQELYLGKSEDKK